MSNVLIFWIHCKEANKSPAQEINKMLQLEANKESNSDLIVQKMEEVEAVKDNLFDRLRDGDNLLKKEFEEFPYTTGEVIQELYKKFTVTSLTYGTVMKLKSVYGFPCDDPWSIFNPIPS